VVKKSAVALRQSRGVADNVDDGDILRVGTGNGIYCGKFTNTEGGDDGGDALDASIAVSCVACRGS
jgi:hypothetical protein